MSGPSLTRFSPVKFLHIISFVLIAVSWIVMMLCSSVVVYQCQNKPAASIIRSGSGDSSVYNHALCACKVLWIVVSLWQKHKLCGAPCIHFFVTQPIRHFFYSDSSCFVILDTNEVLQSNKTICHSVLNVWVQQIIWHYYTKIKKKNISTQQCALLNK